MDLKDLKLFLHLCKTLHFARSSRELHISPSGLTRAVQRLEQELGVVLFERDKRTVRQTDAGVKLQAFAESTLEQRQFLLEQLGDKAELNGTLSLFCSVTASYSFLHTMLQRFRAGHPQIEIQLHTGDAAQAFQRVIDEKDDLAIAALPDKLPDALAFVELGRSRLIGIGPATDCPVRRHIRAASKSGAFNWDQIPLILPEAGLARDRVEQWFREQGVKPRVYAHVSGHEAMVSMVSLGCGIAVVPQVVVDNSPLQDRIDRLDVLQGLESFTVGLCVLKRRLGNPLIKAFWQIADSQTAPVIESAG